MRIHAIVSHGNGAGKTLLLERLLEAWPDRFAAVKFTTVYRDGKFCPKDAQRRCACSKLHDEFNVVSDPETLGQPDTDTGRLVAAGATPVLWCLAREEAHGAAWSHVRDLLPPRADVLTEGNTAMLTIPSDTRLFVVNPCMPRRFWKPNWTELAPRAHAVIVNEAPEALGRRPSADGDEREAALAEVQAVTPDVPRIVARLGEPFREWGGPYLEELLAPTP